MTLVVRFHPLAEVDLIEAWMRYESQSRGLGDQLVSAVETAIERASRRPNAGTPVLANDVGLIIERKVAPNGFPSAIRYRLTTELLIVMAVHHQHRRPDFGTDRIP